MLGKLMKYEWKSTWKLLVPANLLIIVMSFFACMAVKLDFYDLGLGANWYAGAMIILMYALSMFVALVGSAIYLIYHFYTSTYGDQGYLLHTLPVDKHYIIIAKVLVSLAWVLLSSFLMFLSVLFLFNLDDIFLDVFTEFLQIVVTGTYGDVSAFVVMMSIVAMIVGMLVRVLKVAACISLGQLSSNHKLLTAFGYYFAIYIIQQVINGCYQIFLEVLRDVTGSWSWYEGSWEFSLIIGLIYCVVFYLLTWHVMDKQLNLD